MRTPRDAAIARRRQRLAAWALDTVIVTIALTPLNPALWQSEPSPGFFFALWAPATLLALVYLTVFDGGERGATLGKRVVGIGVVDAHTGGPIGYRRAMLRRLTYVAGGLLFYVGWIWMLFDGRRQAWHDKAAGSLVVTTR